VEARGILNEKKGRAFEMKIEVIKGIRPGGHVASPSSAPSGVVRALIVDDEASSRKLLTAMLGEAEIACTTAASADEGLRILETEAVDAILSDLQMPGISGMAFLAKVRPRYGHIAFLMITGVNDVAVGIEAMRKGADDYLIKPLQFEIVMASLGRALEKKRLEREVENYRQHLEEMVKERTGQLERALREVERSYEDTLEALGAAIDLRDSETSGHSHRVTLYSAKIAKEMGVPENELKTIAMGAWLHDIGKLAIPDAILLKPGVLNEEEWTIMRSHAQRGFDLVKRIPFLADAAGIVLTHHERCDGSGYPQGLKAADIPLGARIFAVADTVDAMTSDRPYRAALSFEEAYKEIQGGSGTRYDSQAAGVFLGSPMGTWEAIRHSIKIA
jgi:putative nucleotidyltransferase with HDIG domain